MFTYLITYEDDREFAEEGNTLGVIVKAKTMKDVVNWWIETYKTQVTYFGELGETEERILVKSGLVSVVADLAK